MPPPLEAVKPKVDDPVKLPGAGAPFDPIASALGAPPLPAPPAPVESLAPLAPGGSGSFAPPPPLPLPGGSGSFAPPPPPLSASGGLGSFAPPPLSPTPVDSPPLSLGSAPKSPVNLNETFPSEPGKPGIARVLTFPVATGPAKRSEFIPIDEEPLPGGTGGLAAPGPGSLPAWHQPPPHLWLHCHLRVCRAISLSSLAIRVRRHLSRQKDAVCRSSPCLRNQRPQEARQHSLSHLVTLFRPRFRFQYRFQYLPQPPRRIPVAVWLRVLMPIRLRENPSPWC